MEATGLCPAALGAQSPWTVADVRFMPEQGESHFDGAGAFRRLAYPLCAAPEQPIHDRKARHWRHLHFSGFGPSFMPKCLSTPCTA